MADVFDREPISFVDQNEQFPVLNEKVGLTYQQWKTLVENTNFLYNNLGLSSIEVGSVTTNFPSPGSFSDVVIEHNIEQINDKPVDTLDFLFNIPTPRISASLKTEIVNESTPTGMTLVTAPIKETIGSTQVTTGYEFEFYAKIPKSPMYYLQYVPQSLTAEQKAQARANIGAGTSSFDGNYSSLTGTPTKLSQFENDTNFVNDLSNYYTKDQTYSKTDLIEQFSFINAKFNDYALIANVYNKDEVDAKINNIEADVDLSNYYTKDETYSKAEVDSIVTGGVDLSNYYTKQETSIVIDNKLNSLSDVAKSGDYADLINTPTALSAFANDTNFITNTVDNLTNYYLKAQLYTKDEINELLGGGSSDLAILVVDELPEIGLTGVIYLVPNNTSVTNNLFDEYVYVSNTWERIGGATLDFSNYYTKAEVNELFSSIDLSEYYTKDELAGRIITSAGSNDVSEFKQSSSLGGYSVLKMGFAKQYCYVQYDGVGIVNQLNSDERSAKLYSNSLSFTSNRFNINATTLNGLHYYNGLNSLGYEFDNVPIKITGDTLIEYLTSNTFYRLYSGQLVICTSDSSDSVYLAGHLYLIGGEIGAYTATDITPAGGLTEDDLADYVKYNSAGNLDLTGRNLNVGTLNLTSTNIYNTFSPYKLYISSKHIYLNTTAGQGLYNFAQILSVQTGEYIANKLSYSNSAIGDELCYLCSSDYTSGTTSYKKGHIYHYIYANGVKTITDLTPESGSGGSENIIESISLNGVGLPIIDKNVDISIPTQLSGFENDTGYITAEVDSLTNYYTKTEIDTRIEDIPTFDDTNYYTKVEVNSLIGSLDYVSYASQSLTAEQKLQARSNIGAGTSNFSGDYNDLANLPVIDSEIGGTTNAVQNIAIYSRFVRTDNAIEEVETTANTAYSTAQSASSTANGINTKLNSLTLVDNQDNSYTLKFTQDNVVVGTITIPTDQYIKTIEQSYINNNAIFTWNKASTENPTGTFTLDFNPYIYTAGNGISTAQISNTDKRNVVSILLDTTDEDNKLYFNSTTGGLNVDLSDYLSLVDVRENNSNEMILIERTTNATYSGLRMQNSYFGLTTRLDYDDYTQASIYLDGKEVNLYAGGSTTGLSNIPYTQLSLKGRVNNSGVEEGLYLNNIRIPTLDDLGGYLKTKDTIGSEQVYFQRQDGTSVSSFNFLPTGVSLLSITNTNEHHTIYSEFSLTPQTFSFNFSSSADGTGKIYTFKGENGNLYLNDVQLATLDDVASSLTIDTELSTTSTNAVQNSAITTAINNVMGAIPATDTALDPSSANPLQNAVITRFFNNLSSGIYNNTVAIDANTTQISNKAEIDASNITASSWISKLLTGAVGYGLKVENQNLASNGYIRFSGGLQICWGQSTGNNNSGVAVTFSNPFQQIFSISASGNSGSEGKASATWEHDNIFAVSATGFKWYRADSYDLWYIAIGIANA